MHNIRCGKKGWDYTRFGFYPLLFKQIVLFNIFLTLLSIFILFVFEKKKNTANLKVLG